MSNMFSQMQTKGVKMSIQNVSKPYWDKSEHKWVIKYTVLDKDIGKYEQVVMAQTLVSAERVIQQINQRIK